MDGGEEFQSTNINSLWLSNIYENLKNLEVMERNAYEGCQTLLEYLQIPFEYRKIIIADTQYKNLRLMITEMRLLLTDLTPVMDESQLKQCKDFLDRVDKLSNDRESMVIEMYSATQGKVTSSKVSESFHEALNAVSMLRASVIGMIGGILYIKEDRDNKKKW